MKSRLYGEVRQPNLFFSAIEPSMWRFPVVFVCFVTVAVGCRSDGASDRDPVVLFAAASTIPALEPLTARFTEQTGIPVQTSFAASSTLATTLEQGIEADLFLSASRQWAETVIDARAGSKSIDLLGNILVVIVPSDAAHVPANPAELAGESIRKIAIADPESVPAGIYARQALERAGLWEELEPRMAGAVDVRQALAFVEQRAADAGIVYASDARDGRSVRQAFVLEGHEPIVYPLVLIASPNADTIRLVEFLQSAEAAKEFRRCGFEVLPNHVEDVQ
jgi:molybdate transport system substrate-binding protein